MKTIILSLFVSMTVCGQISLYPLGTPAGNTSGNSYIKDLEGEFDSYIGLWTLDNGSVVFSLQLEKKQMYYHELFNVYRDMVVGEVFYSENGVVIQNSLGQIGQLQNPFAHSLWGYGFILPQNFPVCDDCSEKRLRLVYNDLQRPWVNAEMVLRHENTPAGERLHLTLYEHTIQIVEPGQDIHASIPSGEYILHKVN